jgi:hypothetical protein
MLWRVTELGGVVDDFLKRSSDQFEDERERVVASELAKGRTAPQAEDFRIPSEQERDGVSRACCPLGRNMRSCSA